MNSSITTNELLDALSRDFFEEYDSETIKEMIENEVIDQEAIDSRWLGYPPASEEEINAKEKELGTMLPPSYREFLLTSNGFRQVSVFLDNLFSVEKINWARNTEDQWWFDLHKEYHFEVPDEMYFVYGDEQRSEWSRNEYFEHSLKISEWYDGMCIFLNPIVKHGKEWEVLEHATWFPGTRRYRSFKEYLINTHESNLRLKNGV